MTPRSYDVKAQWRQWTGQNESMKSLSEIYMRMCDSVVFPFGCLEHAYGWLYAQERVQLFVRRSWYWWLVFIVWSVPLLQHQEVSYRSKSLSFTGYRVALLVPVILPCPTVHGLIHRLDCTSCCKLAAFVVSYCCGLPRWLFFLS